MLKSLRIRNYRVFKDLNVDGLHRINLIAGKNNSGKTSLLEAIFLLCGGGDPSLAMNANVIRGQDSEIIVTQSAIITDWKSIFHNLCLDRAIEIEGVHSSQGCMKLRIERGDELPSGSIYSASITDTPDVGSLEFSYSNSVGGETKGRIRLNPGDQPTVEYTERTLPSFTTKIMLSRSENAVDDATLLGKLRIQKRSDLLIAALRVIEPKLQSVIDSSASGTPMIWGDVGLSEMVPLYTMGEGMTRLARIILGMSSAPRGILLIDEIENGLHHSVQEKVWKAIACAAEQFDTQIFATTHSYECVEMALKGLGADGFTYFRQRKTREGDNEAVVYRPDLIEFAIRRNIEVR